LPRTRGSIIAQIGKSVHFCLGNFEILESQSILVGREFLRARAEAKMLKLVDEVLHARLAAEAFADHGFERVDIVRKVDFLLVHAHMVAYSHAPATPIRRGESGVRPTARPPVSPPTEHASGSIVALQTGQMPARPTGASRRHRDGANEISRTAKPC
jgi:hypothetical protein